MTRSCLLLATLVVAGAPMPSSADCWEITTSSGERLVAADIWHVRNRLTQQSALLGLLDGVDTSIAISRVRSIAEREPLKGAQPPSGGKRAPFSIEFLDGRTGVFTSELSLTVQAGGRRSEIPFDSLKQVERCRAGVSDVPPGDETVSAGTVAAEPGPGTEYPNSITLKSGDKLVGRIVTTVFLWQAPYATVNIEPRFVLEIELPVDDGTSGLLRTISGDRMSGVLANQEVAIELVFGETVHIPIEQIAHIRLGEPGER